MAHDVPEADMAKVIEIRLLENEARALLRADVLWRTAEDGRKARKAIARIAAAVKRDAGRKP